MTTSAEAITNWPEYLPYIALGAYSAAAISFGSVVAFSGRKVDLKRKLFIEKIALTFWGVAIAILFKAPAFGFLLGPAGLMFASYVSGRYKRFIFPAIGAAIAGFVAIVAITALATFELLSFWGLIVLAVTVLIGYRLGENYRDFLKIVTTAYSGASLFASGILAILFIYSQKPWLFLVDVLINSLLPILGGLIDNATFVETIIQLVVFAIVFGFGFHNQYAQYKQELAEPSSPPHPQ